MGVAVGSFGESPEAAAVRAHVIAELQRRRFITVAEDHQQADACLTGDTGIWRDARTPRDVRAFGQLELAPCGGGTALWRHEYREGALSAGARSRIPEELLLRVALQFVDRLQAHITASR
jgi:hypothetical protein